MRWIQTYFSRRRSNWQALSNSVKISNFYFSGFGRIWNNFWKLRAPPEPEDLPNARRGIRMWRHIFENRSEGGVVNGFFAMELRILVRWISKVAENEAMVNPDLKNIFRKKSHRKIFFRTRQSWRTFDFPYKLSLLCKGNFPKISPNRRFTNFVELEKIFYLWDFFRKNIF